MRLLLICGGGALGTGARYLLGLACVRWLGADFPFGTLLVNVLGAFCIGVVQQAALGAGALSETARLVLSVGVMGGFTTYSAFAYETLALAERGWWAAAVLNVTLTTTLCLGVCLAGFRVARLWTG